MPPIRESGGSDGGDVVTADAGDLRSLASTAHSAQLEIEGVQRSAGGIIGGLDGRGWNIGAVQARWASVRGQMTGIIGTLAAQALDLQMRALWVEAFENGSGFGGAPGTPIQDPVNSATGNLVHTEQDLALPVRGGLRLELSRTYNSRDRDAGVFGPGWTSSLDVRVDNCGDFGAVVRRETGRRDAYTFNDDGGYDPPLGVRDALLHERSAWRIVAPDGVVHEFDANGRLRSINARGQARLTFERDNRERVVRVVDGVGRWLHLQYDESDRIVAATDCAGRSVHYQYSESGHLVAVTHPGNATTRYTYDENARLCSITDPLGRVWLANVYDDLGRVVEQRNGVGAISHIAYAGPDMAGQVTTLTDGRRQTVQITHDERALVTHIVDALGNAETYTYTRCGHRSSVTDRLGQTWKYEFSGQCQPAAIVDPAGGTVRLEYDAAGNLVRRTDESGATWSFEYDDHRNLITITDPLGAPTRIQRDAFGQAVQITDADGIVTGYEYDDAGNTTCVRTQAGETRYTYDAAGRRVSATDPNGGVSQWEYDAAGRPVLFRDALGSTHTWQYDAAGQLVLEVDPTGARSSAAYDDAGRLALSVTATGGQRRFGYDANSNLIELVDPAGNTSRLEYDALDRLHDVVDARGGRWRAEYDPNGNIVEVVDARGASRFQRFDAAGRLIESIDRSGGRTRYIHDARGYVVSSIDPTGAETRYTYDAVGRPTRRINAVGGSTELVWTPAGRLAAVLDAHGHRAEASYDTAGRLARLRYPDGSDSTFSYDAAGRLTEWTDPTGATRRMEYDKLDRLVREIDPLGRTLDIGYDARGGIVELRQPGDAVTRFDYDAVGNLLTVVDALNGRTRYSYDVRGLLTGITDANGHARGYAFDANGHLIESFDGLGRRTRFERDANGNLVGWEDASGDRARIDYDAQNRPVLMRTTDGAEVRAEYDAVGRWTCLSNGLGALHRTYDALGRVVRETDQFGRTVEHAFDATGLRTRLVYPDGTESGFVYDEADRLRQVRDSGVGALHLTYARGGVPGDVELPGGVRWRSVRDALGRLQQVSELDLAGDVVSSFSYTYDARDNIVSAVENGRRIEYSYDALGRLTAVRDPDGEAAYSYDAVGNRTAARRPDGGEVHATYDAADQLVATQASQLRYDGRGNLVERIDADGRSTSYRWDTLDRLIEVRSGDVCRTFEYNPFGILVRERLGDTVRDYTHDSTGRLSALLLTSDGDSSTRYVHGVVEQRSDEGIRIARSDVRGSNRGLADTSGRVLQYRDYDAWGNVDDKRSSPSGTGVGEADVLGFTGEPQDPATGLVYLRARWYDPDTGRMLGRDPLPGRVADPVSQHPYVYARNNPVSVLDRSGRSASGAFPGNWKFPTSSSIPLNSPFGNMNPFAPFGNVPGLPGPFSSMGPGSWPITPTDIASSAASGATNYADQWLKNVNKLYDEAERASKAGRDALRDWEHFDNLMRSALDPNEARAYARAVDSYADAARNAFKDARNLRNEGSLLEDAFPAGRKIAGVGKVGGPLLDFVTAGADEYAKDSDMSTGSRIRHSAVQGAATAAGSAVGAAGAGYACAQTGVLAPFAFECGAAGGFVGGKLGGLAGKGVNAIIDLF